ncbi:MAG: metallophosphoesterase family protein [Phycisphaera sp.]|nr:MAG: metallophosphoesterase family protein [Phycisphaera sp.]
MRILACSDIHTSRPHAEAIVAHAGGVDVVVVAGDLANQHHGLEPTVDVLQAIEKPTVLVPGNNERPDALAVACAGWDSACVLHGEAATIGCVPFFGLGAGVPVTPFGAWSFDLTEDEAAKLLESCPEQAVIVSHSPPHGVLDVTSAGRHAGSLSVRAAMERVGSPLVVCGHIHDSGGRFERQSGAIVVNAGPVGFVIDLEAGEVSAL